MWRVVLGLGLIALVGCTRYEGPLAVRKKDRADAPGYNLDEQKQRARERYTLIEDDRSVAPPGFVDRYGPVGR